MKRLLIFLLLFLYPLLLRASEIMPLSEVKEGMVGKGRTVFKGNHIEEFEVQILGVLENYLPQQSLILGVLKGGGLEDTGVIAGMSGSPVFIDGKMIGAVAYSWPFTKSAIAGITPIESMLKTQIMPAEQAPVPPPIELAEYYNFENLLKNNLRPAPAISTEVAGFGKIQLTPIATPLTVSGFDPRVVERFQSLFSTFGWHPMQGGAAVGHDLSSKDVNLEPGSPISVQLIKGDFDIGAIGTVTYRDQDKVLAFGHPFFNLGPIDFPMATAKIYTVIPSLYSSFKIGGSGATVGSIKQDQHSAVFGLMGKQSPMIPVSVKLRDQDGTKQAFHFEVANHRLLSALLIDFAFQNTILVTRLGYSESTLKVTGAIQVKGTEPVEINNIFSGAGSFADASQYVASILYTLMSNDFKDVEVKEMEIDVQASPKRKEAELLEVWLDKNEVHAGDDLKLRVMYRPILGRPQTEEFVLTIPDDLPHTHINFLVGGGRELSRQDLLQYGRAFQPADINQLVSLLNSLRSNDAIYVRAYLSEPSLIMQGKALSLLPSNVFSILSSSQTIGSSQKVQTLTLSEDSRPVGYFLSGKKYFSIKVLAKQN
ncbi:MAG TPA: SpoIVB peptidase S55 domain-containing protein [Acidobacteriota bacterium]|nr:SpoIVB peptidase S55 domain-containing protein [Acidobacteriota bacterium]